MIGAEVQTAIYAALAGNSPAIAGGRVYDRPPADAVFPYVTIGDEQVLDDGNTCDDGWEVYSDAHIWSQPATGSKVEAKGLSASVVDRIVGITSIAGFTLISVEFTTSRSMRDPDGITEHSVLTFRFLINPA